VWGEQWANGSVRDHCCGKLLSGERLNSID
jgi:hypothetical protein